MESPASVKPATFAGHGASGDCISARDSDCFRKVEGVKPSVYAVESSWKGSQKVGHTLGELALKIGGRCLGEPNTQITGANPIQDAKPGDLTLLDSTKNRHQLEAASAAAVIVSSEIAGLSIPQLIVGDVHQAFQILLSHFRPSHEPHRPGIHRLANVDPTAEIGRDVWIAEGASVGRNCVIGANSKVHRGAHIMDGCRVGSDCEIFPAAVLYPDTLLGNRVLIHSGVVLGAYGFGYKMENGKHRRTAQLGSVRIDDDVEIGANTTIDRGTYGETTIGEGTKIDNQVMIGHNCKIGKHNLICSQVGIAGSSATGDYVVLAGQVGLKDHIRLGDKVIVAAQSGIASDVESGSIIMGSPAQPIKREMQCISVRNRLPDLREQIRNLEAKLAQLASQMTKSEVDSSLEVPKSVTSQLEQADQERKAA